MLSIGQFSKASGLTVKALRFYHEEGLLVPAAIDRDSNYRYYDERNLEKARVISSLRGLGFSVEETADLLRNFDDEGDILEHLRRQRSRLKEQIRERRDAAGVLDRIIESETQARELMRNHKFEIEEKEILPQWVATFRMTGKYEECGKGFSKLGRKFGRHMRGKPLCLFHDKEYKENDAEFEPCMPLKKEVPLPSSSSEGMSVRRLPGGKCISLMHPGPYDQLKASYSRILSYAAARGHQTAVPSREIYHKGPGMIFKGNPEKYLTEIQFFIEER